MIQTTVFGKEPCLSGKHARVRGVSTLREQYSANSIVVLTTHERFDLFGAAVGEGVDVRFDPLEIGPLEYFLTNVALSGGKLVMLDEAFFVGTNDLLDGLQRFLLEESDYAQRIEIIVVCSDRKPGDRLLMHLVTHLGILDIVYDKKGPELSAALTMLMKRRNTRADVVPLMFEMPGKSARDEAIALAEGRFARPCQHMRNEAVSSASLPMKNGAKEWVLNAVLPRDAFDVEVPPTIQLNIKIEFETKR